MNIVQKAQFVQDYLTSKPRIKGRLIESFGPEDKGKFWNAIRYDIISAISNNEELFQKYHGRFSKKYYDPLEAICDASGDEIVVSFTDLKLYAIIEDLDQFTKFIENARDIVNDGYPCNLNQIILTNKKQKIVFVTSNGDVVNKINNFIRDQLHTTASVIKTGDLTQISIDDFADSYDDMLLRFDRIREYLAMTYDDISQFISLLPRSGPAIHRYTEPNISDCINVKSVEQLIKILKTHYPVTINVINGDHNMIVNGNNNNINNPTDRYSVAQKWIAANPPHPRELTTAYYSRYRSANNNPIADTKFGPLVTGRTVRKGSNGRYCE